MVGTYDPLLVALSYVVAVVASFTALSLARRVVQSEDKTALRWLAIGACAMGLGIWSMHFVGMLAFSLPMPFAYDIPITMLSLLVGIISSAFALYVASREQVNLRQLSLSGFVMGLGIAGMHYTGMFAMKMDAGISYDPLLFTASVLLAIVASMAALWITFKLSHIAQEKIGYKVAAALIMGLAISGMHYTGMAAALYDPYSTSVMGSEDAPNNLWLALTIAASTLFILVSTLITSFFDYKILLQKKVESHLSQLVEEQTAALSSTILQLEQARDDAQAAAKIKTEFMANMSHELRTPMNGILGMSGVLIQSDLDPDYKDMVRVIHNSGEVLLSMINDILDFVKIESDQLVFENSVFNLREAIDDALEMIATSAEAKQLEVESIISPNIPAAVNGDESMLRRILINILSNAIKFSDHGKIVVRAALQHGAPILNPNADTPNAVSPTSIRVHISITDSGIGIPAHKIPTLFDAFSQLDASMTRQFGGTGLGLAICKRLTLLMGGDIWAESELGKGSTFHFTIRLGTNKDRVWEPAFAQ